MFKTERTEVEGIKFTRLRFQGEYVVSARSVYIAFHPNLLHNTVAPSKIVDLVRYTRVSPVDLKNYKIEGYGKDGDFLNQSDAVTMASALCKNEEDVRRIITKLMQTPSNRILSFFSEEMNKADTLPVPPPPPIPPQPSYETVPASIYNQLMLDYKAALEKTERLNQEITKLRLDLIEERMDREMVDRVNARLAR